MSNHKSIYIISLTYKKNLDELESYVAAHRSYLDEGYRKGFLIASGPKNPKVGGFILGKFSSYEDAEAFVIEDPYVVNNAVDYEITEFMPVKWNENFAPILGEKEAAFVA